MATWLKAKYGDEGVIAIGRTGNERAVPGRRNCKGP